MSGTIGDQQLAAFGGTGTIQDRVYNYLVTVATAPGTLDDMGGSLGYSSSILSSSLRDTFLRNKAVLDSLAPTTLSNSIATWGASLTAGESGGTSPKLTATNTWPDQLDNWFTNTIVNEGIGGQTPTEIGDRITANANSDNGYYASIQGGDNILTGSTHGYSGVISGYAYMAAALEAVPNTDYWVMGISGDQSSSAAGINGMDRYQVMDSLYTTYGKGRVKPFVETTFKAKPVEDYTAEELISVYMGCVPYDDTTGNPEALFNAGWTILSGDGTHPYDPANDALAIEYAWMFYGLEGLATVLADDIRPYLADAVENDIVHTMDTFGATAEDFAIVAGNEDGLFDINSSGEIFVTAAGEGNLTEDYYDLSVRGWPTGSTSSSGFRHEANIRLAKAGGGSYSGVTFKTYGAIGCVDPPDFTDFTFVVCYKFPVGTTAASTFLQSTNSTFIDTKGAGSAGRFQWTLQGSSGIVAARNTTPTYGGDSVNDWHWLFVTYNQSTGYSRSLLIRPVSGVYTAASLVTTTSGALTGDVVFGESLYFMTNSNNYGTAAPRDVKRLMLFDHSWDLTSTNYQKFVNMADGEPVDLGANMQVDTIDPFLACDFHGPGDCLPERWVGTGKSKLTMNMPYNLGTVQYSTAG